MNAPIPRQSEPRTVDPDVIAALEHCCVRTNWDAAPEGFAKAKAMGLLAQDPCWRATARGEGVLIAVGLLDPRPEPEQLVVHLIWADHGGRYQPSIVAAFSDGLVDSMREEYEERRREAEEWYRGFGEGDEITFYRTVEHLDGPDPERGEDDA